MMSSGENFHVIDNLKKEEKILKIKRLLQRNLSFLQHYLPFANSHSKDFITHKHWENFLPDSIRSELLSLTEEDLLSLPHSTEANEKICNNDDIVNVDNEWEFQCEYFRNSPKVGKKSDIYSSKMKLHCPEWIHSNLSSFVSEAQKHNLSRSGILSELNDLASRLHHSDNKEIVFISQYMDKKKSHEVEVMGDICAALATAEKTDVVVDLGSGKGYLSTHLALQHKLTVLGVDAQTTNTAGASKRREVLTKQWAGLTRNAKVKNERGDSKKLGKKLKKKMRRMQEEEDRKVNIEDAQKNDENLQAAEISDEVMLGMGTLFLDSDGGDLLSEGQVVSDINYSRSQKKGDEIGRQNELGTDEIDPGSLENKDDKNHDSEFDSSFSNEKGKHGKSDIKQNSEKLVEVYQKEKVSKSDARHKRASQYHFPVTLYIDIDTNLVEIIWQTLAANNCELSQQLKEGDTASSGGLSVMMTGLHTCGGLGASTMRLFVSCDQARVLCNVGCCYHLMEEEFVANPYTEQNRVEEQPAGFPMSFFLRHHRIGLGQYARSFASQAVTRRQQDTKLIAKQFPRIILQAVLSDILGFTREEWKGLRKLDQKCKDLTEYIQRAVQKLNLPAEQFNEERIHECLEKYAVYEERFIAYFQLKLVLAPCIEAVVLLDRMLYLLEQDCIDDVMLVRLFDPVKSPRCHAIIAFKKGNQKEQGMSSQPAPDPVYTLRGAGSPITYLTFHDGPGPNQDLYSGTQDGKIHIWDMEIRRVKASLDAHPGQAVLWIELTPCGKMWTFGRDGILNVWQRADSDWIILNKLSTSAVSFSPGALILDADDSGYVVLPSRHSSVCDVYGMETLTKTGELKPGAEKFGFVMCIASVKDSKTVLIGYENGSIALWDKSKCKLLNSTKVFEESVLCVDYQSDINKGFCGSVTNKIMSFIVDRDELKLGKSVETINPGFNQIRIRGDKKIFVTSGWDHNVRVFSVKKLTPLAVLDYHKDSCQCLAFSRDNLLACGSKDQHISLWKIY